MNGKLRNRCVRVLVIGVLTASCRLFTPGATSILPTNASSPKNLSVPIGGEWAATTTFGKLVFTVDETGTKITKVSYQFSKWTCGPATTSGTIEIAAEWPITNGTFSITNSLDSGGNRTMILNGSYDGTTRKFSGSWVGTSYGETCPGSWEASAPK